MSTRQAAIRLGRANLVLTTPFLGAFVLCAGELLVVGVLNPIAPDLRVSVHGAGALGLAVGAPRST